MSFPAYPAYQDGGVEWLGEVPSHWDISRLKRACGIFASNVDKKSIEGQDAVQLCNYTDVYYNDLIEATLPFMEATATTDQIERFSLIAGDTIITKDSESPDDIARSAYVPITLPGVICGYHLSMVRPFATTHGPFIKLYFDGAHARAYFHTNANGLTRVGLGQYALDNAPIALPPLAEQIAIATFLDRETAKIDALIEEQRRLVALMKEKRQAVISHAVTEGLDPHAPMKDSGIEWLGDVPAHWEVKRLKHIVPSVTVGIVVEPSKHYAETGVPALRSLNVRPGRIDLDNVIYITDAGHQFHSKSRLNTGDIVAVRTGQPGTAAVVPPELDGCNCIDLIVIRKGQRCVEQFLCWYLQAQAAVRQFAEGSGGAIQLHFNIGTAVNLIIPLPPLTEQMDIAAALDSETLKIDQVIATADEAMRLLTERRAALISAAVTGKIDVRGSAEVLPFPIDRARARALVGTEIIERSAGQATFGRVKFQKLAFLAEGHVGISELAGCYARAAAGPLDGALIDEMEHGANSIAGIERDQPGGSGTTNSYRLTQSRNGHRQDLADWLGPDRTAKLDKLIDDFAGLTTKQAEAVATLYGVWNDALIDGASPTDDEIITGFLNDWHPEKREKFRASELPEWLGWMRRHGIVPTGSGPKTTTGRLFV